MKIDEKTRDDVTIFEVKGRLDSKTSPEFEERITAAAENGATKMVVDFTDLEYISSAGLRVILKATKELKRAEGAIVLCSMQDYVREVFEIAGFDTFLPIVDKLDDALAEF